MTVLEKVYTALVTPFNSLGEVDYSSLIKIVEHLYQKGMRGFLIGGTTGEAPTITDQEKEIMVKTIKNLHKDISIMVGIGNNHTTASLNSILYFNQIEGIDAYLCVVPYYNRPSQKGIYNHFMSLDIVSERPIIVYNVPKRCGCEITFETLYALSQNSHHIIGLKQASNHLKLIEDMKTVVPEFIVYCGEDDLLLESLYAGANGIISVASHIIPTSILSMVNDFDEWQNLEPLDDYIKLIAKYCFIEPSPAPVKYLLSKKGLMHNILRLPMVPLSQDGMNLLDQLLDEALDD